MYMQTTDHTFPLPETAAHQLEAIEVELQDRPLKEKWSEFMRINRWKLVVTAATAGIATGISLAATRRQ
jgi:hypothetical protein